MHDMTPAEKLLHYVRDGALDAYEVLENLLTNWLSTDEADDFAEREYDINTEDDEV
jgi:hypothetical protein